MVRVRVGAIALAVGSLLVLTACGGGEPGPTTGPSESVGIESVEPSPTPSPTSGAYVSPPPTSEADAIAHATRAYEFYLATVAEVVAGDADVSKIDEIARGNAADAANQEVAVVQQAGAKVRYSDKFEVSPADSFLDVGMSNDNLPEGNSVVQLVGCLDTSGRSGTNRDGSQVEFFETPRFVVQVTSSYEADSGRWFVQEDRTVMQNGLVSC